MGNTGEMITQLLAQINESKLLYILQISLTVCYEGLKSRVWAIPYPLPTINAFKLLEEFVFFYSKRFYSIIMEKC